MALESSYAARLIRDTAARLSNNATGMFMEWGDDELTKKDHKNQQSRAVRRSHCAVSCIFCYHRQSSVPSAKNGAHFYARSMAEVKETEDGAAILGRAVRPVQETSELMSIHLRNINYSFHRRRITNHVKEREDPYAHPIFRASSGCLVACE